MSLLSTSCRQPDLLAKWNVVDDESFKQLSSVPRLNLETPRNGAAAVPHELAAEDSRIRNRVFDYINAQRMLAGGAYAEQLLILEAPIDLAAEQRVAANLGFCVLTPSVETINHLEELELNSAAQINRGPDGIFGSSRLHWDMILGRDEKIYPSDYLNFDSKMKF